MNESRDSSGRGSSSGPQRQDAGPQQTEKLLENCCTQYRARLRAELLALTVTDIEHKRAQSDEDALHADLKGAGVEGVDRELDALMAMRETERRADSASRRRLESQIHQHIVRLRESEVRFQTLLEQSSDLIWETDAEGLFKWVGPNCRDILGRAPQELIGKSMCGQVGAEQDCGEREKYLSALTDRAPFRNLVNHRISGEGRHVVMEFSGDPVTDSRGRFQGYLGVARDITDRFDYQQRLEKEVADRTSRLSQSETRLKQAQKIAQLGNWQFDFRENRLEWSSEVYRILEVDHQLARLSYQDYLSCVHPEDRDTFSQAFSASFEEQKPFDSVHRILLHDERVKYVRALGETEYEDGMVPVRAFGTVQDITEHRRFEQEMQRNLDSLQRFERMAVGREQRMIELKREINELLVRQGREPKYRET